MINFIDHLKSIVQECDATGDAISKTVRSIKINLMLLENNFYIIESFTNEEGIAKATIAINASHKIFEGHFPGAPIVPGVCMTQIIKEFLEKALAKETRLTKADHLKFLAIINPVENNIVSIEVKYKVNESDVDVTASISNSTATNFKMKAQFILL